MLQLSHLLTNNCEKMRSKRQRRKGKIYLFKCRVPKNRDKVFLSDQCKEIEENNRMGKTRDFFKKITETKGTFHAKMGSIKDRNGMGLTEVEDIKKRWQEYTEELYKKDLQVEESRWRRSRTERSLSLLQIHRKNNRTVKKVYKTTSDR